MKAGAASLQHRALAIHREVGNRVAEGVVLWNPAGIRCEEGLFEETEA